MLVLTRKTKQQIHIGDNITITIIQVKGQAVRLGIEAPRDVRVLRSELADAVPAPESLVSLAAGSRSPRPLVRDQATNPTKPFARPRKPRSPVQQFEQPLMAKILERRAPGGDNAPQLYFPQRLGPAPVNLTSVC